MLFDSSNHIFLDNSANNVYIKPFIYDNSSNMINIKIFFKLILIYNILMSLL